MCIRIQHQYGKESDDKYILTHYIEILNTSEKGGLRILPKKLGEGVVIQIEYMKRVKHTPTPVFERGTPPHPVVDVHAFVFNGTFVNKILSYSYAIRDLSYHTSKYDNKTYDQQHE